LSGFLAPLRNALENIGTSAGEVATKLEKTSSEITTLLGRLQAYAGQTSHTSAETAEATKIVETLSKQYHILGASVDAATGKVKGLGIAQAEANFRAAANRKTVAKQRLQELVAARGQIVERINAAGGDKVALGLAQSDLKRNVEQTGAARAEVSAADAATWAAARAANAAQNGGPPAAETPNKPAGPPSEEELNAIVAAQAKRKEAEQKGIDAAHAARIAAIDNEHLRENAQIHDRYDKMVAEAKAAGALTLDIEEARAIELGALNRRVAQERAKAEEEATNQEMEQQIREGEAVAARRLQLQDEIAEAEIDANAQLSDEAKERAKLELERRKMLRDSALPEDQVNQLFRAKAAAIDTKSAEVSSSVSGTFSGYGARLGGGSNPLSQMASDTAVVRKLLERIEAKTKPAEWL
jgi:hypothetical protein